MSNNDDLDTWSMKERIKTWNNNLDDIKERMKSRETETTMTEGVREVKLYHGLKLISSITLLGEYLDICYCNDTQEYLVLSDELTVYRYSVQGKYISPPIKLISSMVFSKLIWCDEIKTFVCYIPDDDTIKIVTVQFKLIETIKNEFKIKSIFYLPHTNEIIVIGPTIVTRYSMQNLDQSLDSYDTFNFVDGSAGPFWTLEQSCLIPIDPLRLVGSYLTTIYLIPLIVNDNHEKNVAVKFIAKKINASSGPITTLYCHAVSQWIISGDQLGTVSAWTLDLDCIFKCSDGHKGAVTLIISHPSICGFLTTSTDSVLQVWSCNLREKMEKFTELGKISSMEINNSASSIVTLGAKLNFFHMHQLYAFYSPLTAAARILIATNNSLHPTRIIVGTMDNTISLLSSVTGKQLSVQILPSNVMPLSITYSAIADSIYVVDGETGNILVSSTRVRPMEPLSVWTSSKRKITCIVVYDHYDETFDADGKPLKPAAINPIRVRIIAGTDEGEIVIINENTGQFERATPAHDGPVERLILSRSTRYIVSLGRDDCAKAWRILPDIPATLALIHCIYCTTPITDITSMGFIICTVSSTKNSKLHQLVMYNIRERTKLEHHYSKDHSEHIRAITSSESLNICATSSDDGTIRVWNHVNYLLKILAVSISVKTIAFSSLRGDIVFSTGKHLYRLAHENYLPPKYRAQILRDEIAEELDESPMLNSDEYTDYEEDVDKVMALHPVSSIPLGSLDPAADAPCIDMMLQEYACEQLKLRDEDIIQIKNGELQAKKIVKKRALMSDDTWQKHIDDLLGISRIMDDDIVVERHDIWKSVRQYNIKKIPNLSVTHEKASEQRTISRVNPEHFVGFIPNSVIVKIAEEKSTSPAALKSSEKNIFNYIYPSEMETGPDVFLDPNLFDLSQLEDLDLSLDSDNIQQN